jgi:hypothetical protein
MTRYWSVAVLLLAACGTTRYGEKITQSKYEFATYSIDAPSGDWGISKQDQAAEMIQFSRTRSGAMGQEVQWTTMGSSKVPVTASGAVMTEEALVDEYLTEEERNDAEQGRRTKVYGLKNVRKGTTTVGGKKVYFLNYDIDYSTWEVGAKAGSTLLYVYFPPDWKSRRAFYNFVIMETWKTGGVPGVSTDPKAVDPLVASFALR